MQPNSPTDAELLEIARKVCGDDVPGDNQMMHPLIVNRVLAALKDVRDRSQPAPLSADERSDGASLIAAERQRQKQAEGWTPGHDDSHNFGEMAWAAVHYAAPYAIDSLKQKDGRSRYNVWPWEASWDKRGKHSRTRQLVIAGALIAAEIDRLERARVRAAMKREDT